jgi:di/tripeptidase
MDNFLLFICGLAISLISAMGVLVYMASLGYERNHSKKEAVEAIAEPNKVIEPDEVLEIPSVS